jgi:hypothetical protein
MFDLFIFSVKIMSHDQSQAEKSPLKIPKQTFWWGVSVPPNKLVMLTVSDPLFSIYQSN